MQSQKSYTLDRQPLYVGQLQQDQHQALLGGAYGQSNLSSSTHALTEVKPTEKPNFQGSIQGVNFTSPFNQTGYAREMTRSYVKRDVSQADIEIFMRDTK